VDGAGGGSDGDMTFCHSGDGFSSDGSCGGSVGSVGSSGV